ncbi:hypothetical protein [Limosilactobacillus allomucosae]|uniref:hypothetical protein n=1 Tax=Limosilactobacillus TaxID=2742598 RepID=UPI0032630D30
MNDEIFTAAYSIEHSQMRIAKNLSKMKEAALCLAKHRVNHGLDAIDSKAFDKKWQNLQAQFYKELEDCVTKTSGVNVMFCTKCGTWFVDDSQAPEYVLDGGKNLLCQDCFDKAFPTLRSWNEYIVRSEIKSARDNYLGALTGVITIDEAIKLLDTGFKNLTDDELAELAAKACDNPNALCYYTEA